MKFSTIRYKLLALALLVVCVAQATTYSVPKREFRSAWVATVWALDWPRTAADGECCSMDAATQKASMITMLDSLKANNFNAVNFQVRSMCDAMYKSSYEPWSSYLTGTRGQAPSYDPLQFCVEECHKRGMECHAWVNPYRWSSGTDWNTPTDVELKNSGHLITYGTYTILDPAQQWTIDRIVNVCKELITNYDLDGILYDDYFYPSGIPTNSTADDYTEYTNSGTTLSFGDWRRENVNKMVKAVYDMIQETRPEVRFGISPAGVCGTSSTTASKYGVDPCPAGSDWQYNSIFSDPLAWLKAKTIDYISPQVYWKIGATADYGKITPWWGKIAKTFDRHVYISSSISGITKTSDANTYVEYANETELNRTSSQDGNFGMIFYSCKYLYKRAANSLAGYLKSTTFTKPALPPVIGWKQGNNPGEIKNVTLSSGKLSWDAYDNVRYSVYAFPATMKPENFTKQVEYLLGMSYTNSYDIPTDCQGENWQYAVCVVDRVGNEYDPTIYGKTLPQLANPVLVSPAAGDTIDQPFKFTWNKVENAKEYVVELSNDADFGLVTERVTTTDTVASALQFSQLRHATTQYWRVQANADQYYSGVSEIRNFVPMLLTITYPTDGTEEVAPDFTATWYNVHSTNEATVEIADDPDFTKVVYTGKSTTGELKIADDALEAGNTYYMRVKLTVDGADMVSEKVCFTIAHTAAKFVNPVDGGKIYKGEYVELKPQTWADSYQIEISSSATTWGRTRFVETIKDGAYKTTNTADSIKVSSKYLVDGTTYYARVKTAYTGLDGSNHTTDFGPVVTFTYSAGTRPAWITGDVNGDGKVDASDLSALIKIILNNGTATDNPKADVNEDGKIDATDITALMSIILNA